MKLSKKKKHLRKMKFEVMQFGGEVMKSWIKEKLGITALEKKNAQLHALLTANEAQLEHCQRHIEVELKAFRDLQRMDADIGVRGNNTIILSGVYGGRAFVRFWDVGDGEFRSLVERMREMRKYCLVRNVDAPPVIKASFDFEMGEAFRD